MLNNVLRNLFQETATDSTPTDITPEPVAQINIPPAIEPPANPPAEDTEKTTLQSEVLRLKDEVESLRTVEQRFADYRLRQNLHTTLQRMPTHAPPETLVEPVRVLLEGSFQIQVTEDNTVLIHDHSGQVRQEQSLQILVEELLTSLGALKRSYGPPNDAPVVIQPPMVSPLPGLQQARAHLDSLRSIAS
jgi:hypothetical protein